MQEKELEALKILDAVLAEIDRRGYTGAQVSKEFGVGRSWLSDVRRGQSPSVHTVERIYEQLFGRPVLDD